MRKIGVIVDGAGEIGALEELIKKVDTTAQIFGRPLLADLQPKATPAVIARSARERIRYLASKGVDRVVVLIDREDHECPVKMAEELDQSFETLYSHLDIEICVVVKDFCVENWLIADVVALRGMSARFDVPNGFERIAKNADSVKNPVRVLNSICKKRDGYDKGNDPTAICRKVEPLRLAAGSRSFRKFLRSVDSKAYAEQSRLAHPKKRLAAATA